LSARLLIYFLVALVCAVAGAALAVHHPLWPTGMLVLLVCAAVLEATVPGAWLLVVPAGLPLLNFSPWTGWIAWEELDLVILALLAGGYGRLALECGARRAVVGIAADLRQARLCGALCLVLVVTGGWSLLRGVADAGGWVFDWFGAYQNAMNSVRVFKSLFFAVLLWPLLSRQLRTNAARAEQLFSVGMTLGLAWVCLAVLWERANFVGLRNFSSNYRTVATFWEMHVGGAAIDVYLAMAAPFAVWALLSASRASWWLLASLLTLLTGYACLTTFSRGVYLALGVQVVVMAFARWGPALWARRSIRFRGRWARWRIAGTLVVVTLLLLEAWAVLGGDSFMESRIASSTQDMGSRWTHWHSGLKLLHSPLDWLAGKGLGRLPANYAANVAGEDFSGSVDFQSELRDDGKAHGFAVLRTPDDLNTLPGTYALTQRVALATGRSPVFEADIRVYAPTDITVLLCQRHLLYDRNCQGIALRLSAPLGAWQTVRAPLLGRDLGGGALPITFALSVDTPGASVDIDSAQLLDGQHQPLLINSDFSHGLAHWFPAAQSYFVPWHIDNLYLETLIERGGLGVLCLGGLVIWALARFLLIPGLRGPVATSMAAGLLGVLVVGLVSSVLDVPRVALLLYLMPLWLVGKSIYHGETQ